MTDNYFYPFFWQHGEDEKTLRHYIEKISESGMKGVCVESRPHPDFVGEKWWKDLSIIIDECQKREMKIWVLDDSHFPTGYANGQIEKNYPKYRKLYLYSRRYDVVGPFKGARIDAAHLKGRPIGNEKVEVEKVIGVYLVERLRDRHDSLLMDTVIDITSSYKNKTIYLDIPKGDWSVIVLFTTYSGQEEATANYLNPLQKEATQILINEVYEKHYQHVGEAFGKTITAFFSDEPRFGNVKGTDAKVGKDMPLPWRESLEDCLGIEKSYLPLLWYRASEKEEREVRYSYMDKVTQLYHENFVKPLADWCKNHGVYYLGHNIEDNGAHARLGYGAGHFFRG